MDEFSIPSQVLQTLNAAVQACGVSGFALVGGAVRDGLLHHQRQDPPRELPDLDFVMEGEAEVVARHLQEVCGEIRVRDLLVHSAYRTAELVLDGVRIDLASARQEHYPAPGLNPVVEPGTLETDLARRDFTVNAMALKLPQMQLLDLHCGQEDLAKGQLAFLHEFSLADDPTRVVRASRYAARLGFRLAPDALTQIATTLESWPWGWSVGDQPGQAPPALATRMRMELELLFEEDSWSKALAHLQSWRALLLLDPALQQELHLHRRMQRAKRLGLPLLMALIAGASDPTALSARLQLPQKQQRQIEQLQLLLRWLEEELPEASRNWGPAEWSEALEARHLFPELAAHAVCLLASKPLRTHLWKPLLRWWGRWRHLQAPLTARELIAQGWHPGPEIGQELQRLRRERLMIAR